MKWFRKQDNEGIALIIVLGMLTALILVALGFATFLRTERIVASSYVDSVKTRQIALAALDSVIYKINYQPGLGDKAYPSFDLAYVPGDNDFDISNGSIQDLFYGHPEFGGTAFFVSREVQDAVDFDPEPAPGAKSNYFTNRWCALRGLFRSTQNEDVGRYTYILVNDSGRLDFNYAGSQVYSPSNRVAPRDLFLYGSQGGGQGLDVWGSPEDYQSAMEQRDSDYRYYTQAELKYMQEEHCTDNEAWMPNDKHLGIFSMFNQSNRVHIGGEVADLEARKVEILKGFQRAGFQNKDQQEQMYNALLDYVDEDSIPRGPDGAPSGNYYTTEAIPMVNEVVVETDITAGNMMSVKVVGELKFPFYGVTNTTSYDLQLRVAAVFTSPEGPVKTFSINNTSNTAGKAISKDDFLTISGAEMPFSLAPASNQVNMRLRIQINVKEDGQDVDIAGMAMTKDIPITVGKSYHVKAINDPRLNHEMGLWKDQPNPTLEADNNPLFDPSVGGGADDRALFVRNGPLKNTGELGYLGFYKRTNSDEDSWQTLDLVGQHQRVFDEFTVNSNAYTRGLVNLNTRDPQVLATALAGITEELYPGQNTTISSTAWEDAILVADKIIQATRGGGFDRRSKLAGVQEMTEANFPVEGLQESRLRQVMDLLDVRGNYFTVIIRAQPISKSPLDENRTIVGGEIDLVAGIWRDPVSRDAKITHMKWMVRQNVHENLTN